MLRLKLQAAARSAALRGALGRGSGSDPAGASPSAGGGAGACALAVCRPVFGAAAVPISAGAEAGDFCAISAVLRELPPPGSSSAMLVDGGVGSRPGPPSLLPPRPAEETVAAGGAEGVPAEWLSVIQHARDRPVETVEWPTGLLRGEASPAWSGVASPCSAKGPVADLVRGVGAIWMRELYFTSFWILFRR